MKKDNIRYAAVAGALLLALNGCSTREEGPLEKIGREVDDAVDDARKDEKSTNDRIGEAIRDLGDDIEDSG